MASPPACGDLFQMKNGTTCTEKWQDLRHRLHPAQAAVGYAAVERKHQSDYTSEPQAQAKMKQPDSYLPFVLGPKGVPYLVDSHHTISALEVSGHHQVQVTMKKICDWSHLSLDQFFTAMKDHNFMNGTDRSPDKCLPVPVDVAEAIPSKIADLKDDPWRSLAAMVRKVENRDICPKGQKTCLRGYARECQSDGQMTPFFEFRWAHFMNEAFLNGCMSRDTSYWDNLSECRRFQKAYHELLQTNVGKPIKEQDVKAWQHAATLLVPLCRGTEAQNYTLPDELGSPMGGEPLPGVVYGKDTQILHKDPSCAAPKCPELPPMPVPERRDSENFHSSTTSEHTNRIQKVKAKGLVDPGYRP